MTPILAAAPDQTHAMSCMEIWGGNRAIDSGVSAPGIDAWVVSRPHAGADGGGDIHYVSMCAGGKIARFAVADVAGHGDAVAELAVVLRNLMRKSINTADQSRFARRLNEAFINESRLGVFATAILATYFAPSRHLILCNAGHPPPLIYRAATKAWSLHIPEEAPATGPRPRGIPLGIIEPTDYTQHAIALEPGDIVLLYTDSLIEQKDEAGRMPGAGGLRDLCAGLQTDRPDRIAHELIDRVARHAGGRSPDDDLTVMVLHHNGGPAPRPTLAERAATYARLIGLARV